MKRALLLTVAAIISVGTAFAANPILRQKYTADPNAFVWKDRLYVYASYDNNNPPNSNSSATSGYDIMFYTLMSTDDMANWTDHGEVFSVKRDLSAFGNAYAPGAAVKNDKVYLYVPNGGSGIGVVTADRPEGPFTGGKSIISKSDANNTNVPWLFDPAGFVDSDGQGYIYFGGGDTQAGSNLRVAKLNSDMMSVQFPAKTIENATRSFEAAFMHKYNGKYYFSYSQNFDGAADIAYMIGDNPMGPFTFKGTIVPNGADMGYGNNHASVVEYKNKWYVFYHDRRLKSANGNPDGERRSVSVDKLEYNTDGTIKKATLTTAGPDQIKNFNPYDTVLATTMFKQSGSIKTAICSAPNPGTITNGTAAAAYNSPGDKGDRCVMLISITDGSWVSLKSVDFGTAGATKFVVRAASTNANASIEIRTGTADNSTNNTTLVGTCSIGSTGGLTTWKEIECNVSNLTGVKNYLYLVFKGNNFRVSKYIFKSGSTPSVNVTCNLNNLQPSYVSGSEVPRPNVSCGTGVTVGTAFLFNLSGSDNALEGWNSNGTHAFWTPGTKNITLSEVTCGGNKVTLNPAVSCGSFEVVAESSSSSDNGSSSSSEGEDISPILHNYSQFSILNSQLVSYYTIKGEPLGNVKPQKAGVYIVKQGNSVKKIAVR